MKKLWIICAIGLSLSACGGNSAIKPQPATVTLSASQIAQDSIAAGFDAITLVESSALQLAMQGKISIAQLKAVDADVSKAQQMLNSALLFLPANPDKANAEVTAASKVILPDQNLLNLKK